MNNEVAPQQTEAGRQQNNPQQPAEEHSMSGQITLEQLATHEEELIEIRNQLVRDPTPAEIRERSAEVRSTWSETRWRKERRRFRNRAWTVPEVTISPVLLES